MNEVTTTPNETTANTETQQAQTAGTTTADAKFTQADLDRVAGDTRSKAKQSERDAILKALGVEKLEDAEAVLKAHREKVEADKSEVERAAGETQKAIQRAEKAEAELTQERAARRIDLRDRHIVKAASSAKAQVPEDVVTWAEKNAAEALAKVVKDDGTVDEKAIETLVKQCQEARPAWFQPARTGGVGSPSNAGGRVPSKINPNAKITTSGRL